jgi:hypothetical protein
MKVHRLIEIGPEANHPAADTYSSTSDAAALFSGAVGFAPWFRRTHAGSAARRTPGRLHCCKVSRGIWTLFLVLALPPPAGADSQWVLERSTITYHVSHPLHETEGVSHAARGEAVCRGGTCAVLVAVPVKSFDSGDSNRDLHMLQDIRGAQYPIVSVRIDLPEARMGSPMVPCDLEITFAGQTVRYKQVPFRQVRRGARVEISGTIPVKLSDFKIPLPSLLTIPVKEDVPIRVDTIWRETRK